MTKPIKYLDNKSFIFSNECENRSSVPFGMRVNNALLNILLSFIKKNEINRTENKPILKDPKVPTIEFSKLGIDFKLANTSALCNSLKISIFLDVK